MGRHCRFSTGMPQRLSLPAPGCKRRAWSRVFISRDGPGAVHILGWASTCSYPGMAWRVHILGWLKVFISRMACVFISREENLVLEPERVFFGDAGSLFGLTAGCQELGPLELIGSSCLTVHMGEVRLSQGEACLRLHMTGTS